VNSQYDVVIVGGGLVGAALACALGNSSLKVALVDRSLPPGTASTEYDVRVSAITLASMALFENLGVWDSIFQTRVSPVREMRVWSSTVQDALHFNAAEIGEPVLFWIIENRVMQHALIERINQFTNIHYLAPVEPSDITLADNIAVVSFPDGRRLSTRLLVGADGAESAVRQTAHITTQSLDMQQKGIVATVTTEKPHDATARQRFLTTGPLAFLPLDDPNTSSIVWSADTARADQLMKLEPELFITELQSAFGDSLGAVTHVGPRAVFPLALSHAKAYTAPHLALVGDAAHTVHPLAGQGVNLGFLDAAALAEVLLDAAAKHKNIGAHDVLRRYERWRKADNLAMISLTGGFKYLFGTELPPIRRIRDIGLKVTNATPPIKNLMMRRASGLVGDLPKLAKRAGCSFQ